MDSTIKGPVMRKACPCYDVITVSIENSEQRTSLPTHKHAIRQQTK